MSELGSLLLCAGAPSFLDRARDFVLSLVVSGRLSQVSSSENAEAWRLLRRVLSRDNVRALQGSQTGSGWPVIPLEYLGAEGKSSISDGPFGSKLKSSHYVAEPGYRVIRLGNIGRREFKDLDRSHISAEHFSSLARYHLNPGDIVVASLGDPPGRATIVPDGVLPALNKADCFRVRVHPAIDARWIEAVLNAPAAIDRATDLQRGDTRGRITLSHLRSLPIPVPPRAEQERLASKVDKLLALLNELGAAYLGIHEARLRARTSCLNALVEKGEWDRVRDNWDALFTTPESVDDLRQAILDLAVRGRLVEQREDEGKGEDLLAQIARERKKAIASKEIRKPRALPKAGDVVPAFPTPPSWTWTYLARTLPYDLTDGDWVESKDQDPSGSVRLIQLADVGVGRYLDKSSRFLTEDTADRLNCTFLVEGDVLVARLPNPLARACSFPGVGQPAVTAVDVAIARPGPVSIDPGFLVHLMNSPYVKDYADAVAAGTTRKRVSTGNLRRMPVPIPPLGEQHRIVAKVDEFMALCDELEARLREVQEISERLAESVVHHASQ